MNNDSFNNGNNSMFPGMQPQNNMNPGTPEVQPVQPQFNANQEVQPVQPQFNVNQEVQPVQESEIQNNNVQQNTWMSMQNMNPQTSTNQTMPMPGNPAQQNSWGGMQNMNPQPNQGMVYNTYNPYYQNQNNVPQQPKKPINLPLIIGIAIGGIAVIILILFLTGVLGGKKLTCSKEDSYDGMTKRKELVISFKDDKPSKLTTKQTIDYGTNTVYKEMIKEQFDAEYEYSKEQGYDAKLTSGDTSYTLTITVKKEDIESSVDDEEATYEELKEYYEDEGYTCK